jgi:hypothetical protein
MGYQLEAGKIDSVTGENVDSQYVHIDHVTNITHNGNCVVWCTRYASYAAYQAGSPAIGAQYQTTLTLTPAALAALWAAIYPLLATGGNIELAGLVNGATICPAPQG